MTTLIIILAAIALTTTNGLSQSYNYSWETAPNDSIRCIVGLSLYREYYQDYREHHNQKDYQKDDLKNDLNSKKEIVELRVKSLEKQETQIKDKASKLQEEVLKEMKQD